MPTPRWFILSLLLINLGACVSFALQGQWPWVVIYGGAALIQAGCLWLIWWVSQ